MQSKEDALRDGINCVSLAHLALKDLFECELPPDLGCAEMYQDSEYFKPVEGVADAQIGDLAWFGIADPPVPPEDVLLKYDQAGRLVNWREFPVKHVGIVCKIAEVPHILHASYFDGTNVVSSMAEITKRKRYAQFYGITRYRDAA